jgi:DNA polymerase-1
MNFGMFYGQSPETFQEKHGIPAADAKKYIDWAKREFKRVWEWESEVQKEVKDNGHLFSPYGRKRRFHLLTPENQQASFREAVNFLPQTTASDCTLRSIIELCREIDWNRGSIVLTVHDSIIGDVKDDYIDEFKVIIKQIMEERPKVDIGWQVPFKVDIQVGPTWGQVK